MAHFRINDVKTLETTPITPANLGTKVGEMILSSTNVHAKVESVNKETGEYRIVLQGTLEREDFPKK